MELSNQKRSRKVKRIFNITCLLIMLTAIVFLWMGKDRYVILSGLAFVVLFIGFYFINMNYFYINTDGEQILVRFYPIISFLKKDYESIEFPKRAFADFEIRRSFFYSDMVLTVKTKRGYADYPSVSLTALSKHEIDHVEKELQEILKNKQ